MRKRFTIITIVLVALFVLAGCMHPRMIRRHMERMHEHHMEMFERHGERHGERGEMGCDDEEHSGEERGEETRGRERGGRP